MTLLVLGLALFLGIHLVPAIPPLRAALAGALGEAGYKKMFTGLSLLGFALIVAGYAMAPRGEQWLPRSVGARHASPLVMIVSFILLAAANMKGRIRRALRHPMLLGVGLWALVHLLANGHAKATLVFGGFLAYVVIDLVSATARGAVKPFELRPRHDLIAIGGGTVAALAFMTLHRFLVGVAAVPWSL